jgi:hypothetical protein
VNSTLISVAEIRPTVAVAVGDASTIVNLNGRDPASWTKEQSGTQQNLNAVVAAGGSAWVVGDKGAILYNSGGGWVSQSSGTTKNLYGITVVSSTLAWAVGEGGTILKVCRLHSSSSCIMQQHNAVQRCPILSCYTVCALSVLLHCMLLLRHGCNHCSTCCCTAMLPLACIACCCLVCC